MVNIQCSGCGKDFPVNLKKHLHRDYRFCPFCHIKVKVGIKLLAPSTEWLREKALGAIQKILMHRQGKTTYFSTKERELILSREDEAMDLHESMFKKPKR